MIGYIMLCVCEDTYSTKWKMFTCEYIVYTSIIIGRHLQRMRILVLSGEPLLCRDVLVFANYFLLRFFHFFFNRSNKTRVVATVAR